MGEHAKLSPSSANRWMTCTASPLVEINYPEPEESPYAAEGTEAHRLLEAAIKAKTRPSALEPDHPAAKDVDQAYDLVAPALANPNYIVLSETQVKLHPQCWGTADIIVMGDGGLTVIDYKHGRGVLVEMPAVQLEIYAAAALRSLGWMAPEEIGRVATIVVQPRAEHPDGPVRTVTYRVSEIEARAEEIIQTIELIEDGDKVELVPTEKGCKWCRASGDCKAQAKVSLEKARAAFTPCDPGAAAPAKVEAPSFDAEKNRMTIQDKLAVFNAMGQIKDFLNAVEANLMDAMLAGEQVPGKKLVAGRSNRKWSKDEAEMLEFLTKELKLKKADIAPPKLLGPAKVEKMVDPKARNGKKKLELLQSVIVKPEGKPTIVDESDKRPALAGHFTKAEPSADPLA